MPQVTAAALIPGFAPPNRPVNPYLDQAEETVTAWLWRIGFLRDSGQEAHLRSFRFGLYHGLVTPDADLAGLVLGLKWFCWGSLADDQYDNYDGVERDSRMAAIIADARAILAGATHHRVNPVNRGLVEFWPDLMARLSPGNRRRTAADYLDYLTAVRWQNRFHTTGAVPDFASFVGLRRHTIAMVFQADVLAAVSRITIPEPLWTHRMFRELLTCFADVTAWHNDVYGLEKDLADGQLCNTVLVVEASEACSREEAVRRVLDRAEHRQRLFLELEQELPDLAASLGLRPKAAREAARLAEQLRAYAAANLVWVTQTRRYDLDRPRIRGTFDDVLTGP